MRGLVKDWCCLFVFAKQPIQNLVTHLSESAVLHLFNPHRAQLGDLSQTKILQTIKPQAYLVLCRARQITSSAKVEAPVTRTPSIFWAAAFSIAKPPTLTHQTLLKRHAQGQFQCIFTKLRILRTCQSKAFWCRMPNANE